MTDISIVTTGFWDWMPCGMAPDQVVFVPPMPWEGARVGKCYINVKEMIRRHAGEAVYGWALTDCGPFQVAGGSEPPLYRRWLNHVVWRDSHGQMWEVSPNAVIDNHAERQFLPTDFVLDPEATFEIISDEEWFTRPTRYIPLRPEGVLVADLLTQAQHAVGEQARNQFLGQALSAIQLAGFRPREWKVETVGQRTGSIWLIAE
jgi:hypothetical protein